MLVQADPAASPHFFLLATRAPLGGSGPQGERVAVLVARDRRNFAGDALDAGQVLLEDQALEPAWQSGPFRHEAEIAPYKPEPDVVVVDATAAMLPGGPFSPPQAVEAALALALFGNVAVDRGAGFGAATPLHFGWRSRRAAPRLALAGRPGVANDPGDPSSLSNFNPALVALPDQFRDAFHNGQPLAGQALLEAGHRLRFTDTTGAVDVVTTLVIPPPPVRLAISQQGAPLSPPVALRPQLDTVVMDRGTASFTLVWRAVLRWEARFAAATLQVH